MTRPSVEPLARELSAETAGALAAIGARIRDLRLERGLTLKEVSLRTGLSVSMLSLMERGKTSPSIGTLVVVCSALDVQMGDLLVGGPHAERDPVSRCAGQPVFGDRSGVLRRILRDDSQRGVEIAMNEYAPDTGSAPEPVSHAGYEYGVVLAGELTVELEGTSHVLGVNDLISYESSRPHRIWNYGPLPARALWVNIAGSGMPVSAEARAGVLRRGYGRDGDGGA